MLLSTPEKKLYAERIDDALKTIIENAFYHFSDPSFESK
jgi:hypothetical protein